MKLHNMAGRQKKGFTTWGCMWKQGRCKKDTTYILKDADIITKAMQTRITAYWPDGSVKWTAHTADAESLTEQIEVVPIGEILNESKKNNYDTESVTIIKKQGGMEIYNGEMKLWIPETGKYLFESLEIDGRLRAESAKPVLLLEEPISVNGNFARVEKSYDGLIEKVSLEEKGPLRVIVKYEGIHVSESGERKLPFIIRMKLCLASEKIDFVHTFLYDGDEDCDFLKGIGLSVIVPMTGHLYNRHVMFEGTHGVFHESLAQLISWQPRVPEGIYAAQMSGEELHLNGEDEKTVNQILQDMPFWSEYDLCQDSPSHYKIKKKIKEANCCYLDGLHGERTEGAASFGDEQSAFLCSIRDFWQTYPSGYTFRNLDGDCAEALIWLYSPSAEPMDFRHYANRGYNKVYYEGYDYKGATPYGIASTSEYSIELLNCMIPTEEKLHDFSQSVNLPAQYVGEPEFYHDMKAFGYWSLPKKETPMETWIEEQLDKAVEFYENEVEQRNWYGLFNYGDFMHTYDRERHQWRYDMGGYAWDNTELVPTLWLWLMFMRTGRPDVFALAEKLSRHASEVDVYHMGKYKGLGSRHNVRHWGCPCKEARIAMAAHHRFYYYMTGDYRLEDIFEELKDNEMTFLNRDPLGDFYNKEEMVYPSHARSGPDWSSLCANWLTRWERFNDEKYKQKIEIGIADIKQTPLKLISGPDFEFDPTSVHLRYIGERAAGGTHLQICMGAPQIWMEMADLLEDEEWKQMMADYGRFYYLSREKQLEESREIIGEREFTLPFMAAAMGAYGAWYRKDIQLAKTTWCHLLHAIISNKNHEGFAVTVTENKGNHQDLVEIPWISTNFTAQWCLNVIMALEFIGEELPVTLIETDELVASLPKEGFRKA